MRALLLPATASDAAELACFMRDSDREECLFNARAFGRHSPEWSIRKDLMRAVAEGDVWSMWLGDALMGMGGCKPQPTGMAALWFLGTDLADRHPITMTRACRQFIAFAHSRNPGVIGNVVPKTLVQRVAWLQHLGFDMREGEAQSMLQGHVIFWSHGPARPRRRPRGS